MSGHRLEVTGHCDCCLGHPAKPGSYWTLSQRGSKPRIRVKPQPGVTPARSVDDGSYTDGGNVVNAFDQDLTLIRLITECDFACRQPKAFIHGTYAES